jgi:dolichyl-phosphate beta-glucosyltransferase
LPETLKKVRDFLSQQKYDYEVIIIDDGSSDDTSKVSEEVIKGWNGFRVISYTPNRGKGYAVKTGMLAAKGEWRLLMDADNSTDISEIEKFFNFTKPTANRPQITVNSSDLPSSVVSSPYAVIIGSRYLNKDSIKVKQPLSRRIVSRFGNFLIRILLGIKMVDTQCGFKMFSAKATEMIFPLQTIDRWGFDMEVLAIAIKKGYKVKEVAVDWYDAEGSQVKKSAAWKTLKELMAIKWNLITGKYSETN